MEDKTNKISTNQKLSRRKAFVSMGTKIGVGLLAFIPATKALLQSPLTATPLLSSTVKGTIASQSQLQPHYVGCTDQDPTRTCTPTGNPCQYPGADGKTYTGEVIHCYSQGGTFDCGIMCLPIIVS